MAKYASWSELESSTSRTLSLNSCSGSWITCPMGSPRIGSRPSSALHWRKKGAEEGARLKRNSKQGEADMRRMAVEMARQVHQRHPGLSFPLDMEGVVTAEGCTCLEWPFLDPIREVKRGEWIGVADWLDAPERRRHLAHALGHHLMHRGNQLSFRTWHKINRWKQEREAEEFAAHLLIPEDELEKARGMDVWALAESFGVPEDLVWQRVTAYATEAELARWRAGDHV